MYCSIALSRRFGSSVTAMPRDGFTLHVCHNFSRFLLQRGSNVVLHVSSSPNDSIDTILSALEAKGLRAPVLMSDNNAMSPLLHNSSTWKTGQMISTSCGNICNVVCDGVTFKSVKFPPGTRIHEGCVVVVVCNSVPTLMVSVECSCAHFVWVPMNVRNGRARVIQRLDAFSFNENCQVPVISTT